jgi:hypothetical protein
MVHSQSWRLTWCSSCATTARCAARSTDLIATGSRMTGWRAPNVMGCGVCDDHSTGTSFTPTAERKSSKPKACSPAPSRRRRSRARPTAIHDSRRTAPATMTIVASDTQFTPAAPGASAGGNAAACPGVATTDAGTNVISCGCRGWTMGSSRQTASTVRQNTCCIVAERSPTSHGSPAQAATITAICANQARALAAVIRPPRRWRGAKLFAPSRSASSV